MGLPFAIVLSFRARGPLLPPQRWRAVTWTGWHCGLACVAFIAIPAVLTAMIQPPAIYGWFLDQPYDVGTAKLLVRLVGSLMATPFLVATWWLIVGAMGGA